MSVQLALLLKFPREVFHLAPPVPVNLEEGARITCDIGQIGFYFDDWDAPHPNRAGGPPVTAGAFFAHFVPSAPPAELERALAAQAHPYAPALYRWASAEEEAAHAGFRWSVEDDDEEEAGAEAEDDWADARLEELRRDEEGRACDRLFADPVLGRYLASVGDRLREGIRDFLAVLRIEHGQYLIPGTLPITTARNRWLLSGGRAREVGDSFLRRLLGLRSFADAGDINEPIQAHHWPDISARLQRGRRSPFFEVLLASARRECDPDLGNPRLALVEAVAALEVEVRKLVTLRLRRHGIAGADRVARETPLAELITAWIRRDLRPRATAADGARYDRCALAIRECSDLIHHERADLSPEWVRQQVDALAELARRARAEREAEASD